MRPDRIDTPTIADGVEATLFARYYDVGHRFGVLPALRREFQMSIPVNHRQDTIGRISGIKLRRLQGRSKFPASQPWVLRVQFFVDFIIRGSKGEDVGLVD
jgi:hypothetical protein